MPKGRGKQTTAVAGVPPDSKGTNRRSIAVADISPAAWRSALSRAVSSRHWKKSPQTFSLVVTVSELETTHSHTAHQHRPAEITIYYRFHPLRTHSLPVVRLYELPDESCYVVRRTDGRPLAVPVWMTHPEAAHATIVSRTAHLPLRVLLELRRISVTSLSSSVHNVREEDHDAAAPTGQTTTTTFRRRSSRRSGPGTTSRECARAATPSAGAVDAGDGQENSRGGRP